MIKAAPQENLPEATPLSHHPETAADRWEVEAIYDTVCAGARRCRFLIVCAMVCPRSQGLTIVARDAGGILLPGHIRYWRSVLDPPLAVVGPVAVPTPPRQGEGLGRC